MTHALEIDRVSLGYPQGGAVKTVLHDFDLAVRSGELVSLLGASGVGKSSLLRVLAGLKQALSGQVRLFGEPFSRPHPRVGLVFQSAALLPWLNVRDNLAFGLDFKRQPLLGEAERKRRMNDALEEVGLAHAAQKYPSELSGGMAQRAALARAVARQPQVGAGGRKAGEWQPETPFPRHGRLHDLSRLRGEIMQSLYHAQQDTQQAATVEFVI